MQKPQQDRKGESPFPFPVRKRVAPLNVMPKDRVVFFPDMRSHLSDCRTGQGTVCNRWNWSPLFSSCVACLAPCLQEEADTRLLLHVADAVQKGCKKVTIRTVDKDVVVLAVGCLWCWASLCL